MENITLSVCVLGVGGGSANNTDCNLGQELHCGIGPTEGKEPVFCIR